MNFLSIDWFKSKIENIVENTIEKNVNNKINSLFKELEKSVKPYKQLIFIDNTLTIILENDESIIKENVNSELFKLIRNSETKEELLKYLYEEPEKKENIIKNINKLLETELFEVINSSVYYKEINRSIPEDLCLEFINKLNFGINSEQFQSLIKFWKKCCLNPNYNSANDLFNFLKHHNFKIDRHGNFYAYRRVVSKNIENKELVDFVSNTYNKIKAIWKKKPIDFIVTKEEGSITKYFIEKVNDEGVYKGDVIGNLQELYLDLPNMQKNMFTSAHTGKEDYRVGEVISMPRYEGNDNNSVNCSKGFHAASKTYDYSSFGDTPILVIINPVDVLAVPKTEVGKLRTCRWFFASVLDESEKYILDDDAFDVTDLGDIFEEKCLVDMENYVKNSYVEELTRHTYNISNISSEEIAKICADLSKNKDLVKNRINYF